MTLDHKHDGKEAEQINKEVTLFGMDHENQISRLQNCKIARLHHRLEYSSARIL